MRPHENNFIKLKVNKKNQRPVGFFFQGFKFFFKIEVQQGRRELFLESEYVSEVIEHRGTVACVTRLSAQSRNVLFTRV